MKKPTRAAKSGPSPVRVLDNEPRPFTLVGRTALVTGSSKGLGKAIALALGAAGAKVALNTKMCHAVSQKLGPIDILVCNATPAQPQKPFELYDWAFHQQMLDFFVKSPFLLTRAVLPQMKERRFGRIVNIGSEVLRRGVPNFSPYVAAKGAQAGWTRSMATELAPWNVTVNMVSPGWIPVERHEQDPAEHKDAYKALIPMRRWGVPADIGGVVTFLAGDAAAFVTGQDLAVNGGVTVG
jgi:3-oxoacyl-[acyl-carrier protein] reductase